MSDKTTLTSAIVREFLSYNPDTGILTWRERDRKWFHRDQDHMRWSTCFSGKVAGCDTALGYTMLSILNRRYLAHRIVWLHYYGKFPDLGIDHIDGNGRNNSIRNLRAASQAVNCKNMKRPSDNTSGAMGVWWNPPTHSWRARISRNGKDIHLGLFTEFKDAVAARKVAEIKFGDYTERHGT